jgi:Prenyltransferase and squalene oxidase repeat
LEWWLCHRQMRLEGGFQGRTNKLVDGCYSFWQVSQYPTGLRRIFVLLLLLPRANWRTRSDVCKSLYFPPLTYFEGTVGLL